MWCVCGKEFSGGGRAQVESRKRSERTCERDAGGDQASGSSLVTDLIERGFVNCKPEPDGTARWDSEAGGGLGVWGS